MKKLQILSLAIILILISETFATPVVFKSKRSKRTVDWGKLYFWKFLKNEKLGIFKLYIKEVIGSLNFCNEKNWMGCAILLTNIIPFR